MFERQPGGLWRSPVIVVIARVRVDVIRHVILQLWLGDDPAPDRPVIEPDLIRVGRVGVCALIQSFQRLNRGFIGAVGDGGLGLIAGRCVSCFTS